MPLYEITKPRSIQVGVPVFQSFSEKLGCFHGCVFKVSYLQPNPWQLQESDRTEAKELAIAEVDFF